jgi:hypothetical protein
MPVLRPQNTQGKPRKGPTPLTSKRGAGVTCHEVGSGRCVRTQLLPQPLEPMSGNPGASGLSSTLVERYPLQCGSLQNLNLSTFLAGNRQKSVCQPKACFLLPPLKIDPKKWPKGIRPLSMDEGGVGIDAAGVLYWDGTVMMRRQFELRWIELTWRSQSPWPP